MILTTYTLTHKICTSHTYKDVKDKCALVNNDQWQLHWQLMDTQTSEEVE